ncbi:hypothetical protein CAOG_000908 [Capsaspora owczarzaki ATCC 30864]|uniref:Uncharacterized protein n=1 Tax=Capsaspora owczarzaki (strain ATCC 30864) TaxID=595528 RepID=A0A0D2VHL5_CAPO3|nr:hypothetical protein CAOG_000908 [Capsaspora owczarzaki ATCC 30864]
MALPAARSLPTPEDSPTPTVPGIVTFVIGKAGEHIAARQLLELIRNGYSAASFRLVAAPGLASDQLWAAIVLDAENSLPSVRFERFQEGCTPDFGAVCHRQDTTDGYTVLAEPLPAGQIALSRVKLATDKAERHIGFVRDSTAVEVPLPFEEWVKRVASISPQQVLQMTTCDPRREAQDVIVSPVELKQGPVRSSNDKGGNLAPELPWQVPETEFVEFKHLRSPRVKYDALWELVARTLDPLINSSTRTVRERTLWIGIDESSTAPPVALGLRVQECRVNSSARSPRPDPGLHNHDSSDHSDSIGKSDSVDISDSIDINDSIDNSDSVGSKADSDPSTHNQRDIFTTPQSSPDLGVEARLDKDLQDFFGLLFPACQATVAVTWYKLLPSSGVLRHVVTIGDNVARDDWNSLRRQLHGHMFELEDAPPMMIAVGVSDAALPLLLAWIVEQKEKAKRKFKQSNQQQEQQQQRQQQRQRSTSTQVRAFEAERDTVHARQVIGIRVVLPENVAPIYVHEGRIRAFVYSDRPSTPFDVWLRVHPTDVSALELLCNGLVHKVLVGVPPRDSWLADVFFDSTLPQVGANSVLQLDAARQQRPGAPVLLVVVIDSATSHNELQQLVARLGEQDRIIAVPVGSLPHNRAPLSGLARDRTWCLHPYLALDFPHVKESAKQVRGTERAIHRNNLPVRSIPPPVHSTLETETVRQWLRGCLHHVPGNNQLLWDMIHLQVAVQRRQVGTIVDHVSGMFQRSVRRPSASGVDALQVLVLYRRFRGSGASTMLRLAARELERQNYRVVIPSDNVRGITPEVCDTLRADGQFVLVVDDAPSDWLSTLVQRTRGRAPLGVIVAVCDALPDWADTMLTVDPFLTPAEVGGFVTLYSKHFPESREALLELRKAANSRQSVQTSRFTFHLFTVAVTAARCKFQPLEDFVDTQLASATRSSKTLLTSLAILALFARDSLNLPTTREVGLDAAAQELVGQQQGSMFIWHPLIALHILKPQLSTWSTAPIAGLALMIVHIAQHLGDALDQLLFHRQRELGETFTPPVRFALQFLPQTADRQTTVQALNALVEDVCRFGDLSSERCFLLVIVSRICRIHLRWANEALAFADAALAEFKRRASATGSGKPRTDHALQHNRGMCLLATDLVSAFGLFRNLANKDPERQHFDSFRCCATYRDRLEILQTPKSRELLAFWDAYFGRADVGCGPERRQAPVRDVQPWQQRGIHFTDKELQFML